MLQHVAHIQAELSSTEDEDDGQCVAKARLLTARSSACLGRFYAKIDTSGHPSTRFNGHAHHYYRGLLTRRVSYLAIVFDLSNICRHGPAKRWHVL
jgi:hypothetical protein